MVTYPSLPSTATGMVRNIETVDMTSEPESSYHRATSTTTDEELYGATPPRTQRLTRSSQSMQDVDRHSMPRRPRDDSTDTDMHDNEDRAYTAATLSTPQPRSEGPNRMNFDYFGGQVEDPDDSPSTFARSTASSRTLARSSSARPRSGNGTNAESGNNATYQRTDNQPRSGFKYPSGFRSPISSGAAGGLYNIPARSSQRHDAPAFGASEAKEMPSYRPLGSRSRKRSSGFSSGTDSAAPRSSERDASSLFISPEPSPTQRFGQTSTNPSKKRRSLYDQDASRQSLFRFTSPGQHVTRSSTTPTPAHPMNNASTQQQDPIPAAFNEIRSFMTNFHNDLMPTLIRQAEQIRSLEDEVHRLKRKLQEQGSQTEISFQSLTDSTNKSIDRLTTRVDELELVSDKQFTSDEPIGGTAYGGPMFTKQDRGPGIFSGYMRDAQGGADGNGNGSGTTDLGPRNRARSPTVWIDS